MPLDKLRDLLSAIQSFCFPAGNGRRHSLRQFMQMAGWINWALNIFPLLKPALSGLFGKIRGKQRPDALIYVNKQIRFELSWFASHARQSDGILIMESIAWRPVDANFVFFCDASLDGLGCYFPAFNTGFHAVAPVSAPLGNIFFLEALSVCWAIHIAHRLQLRGNIAIFTDNENTVALFNRLYSSFPAYNPILLAAANILLLKAFRIQVLPIPGDENVVADALSRSHFQLLTQRYPDVQLSMNEPLPTLPSPPRETMGSERC